MVKAVTHTATVHIALVSASEHACLPRCTSALGQNRLFSADLNLVCFAALSGHCCQRTPILGINAVSAHSTGHKCTQQTKPASVEVCPI